MRRNVRVRRGGTLTPAGVWVPSVSAAGEAGIIVPAAMRRSIALAAGVGASGSAGTVGRSTTAPGESDNQARIESILAGRAPHFSYSTPADPVITREVTVTNATNFNSAAAVNGTRIIINNSFSGSIQITGSDIDVVMSNSATHTGTLSLGGASYSQRVRWTGGNVGTLSGIRFRDYLFDDFYALAYSNVVDALIEHNLSNGWDGSGNPPFQRVAFINSTLELQGSASQSESQKRWALHTGPVYQHNDLILANVKFLSNHQLMRIQSVENLIFFDCVFNPNGTANNSMRIHPGTNGTNDVWIKDCWGRGLFTLNSGSTTPGATNVRFDNYDRYYAGPTVNQAGGALNAGTWLNSTHYGGTFSVSPITDGGGNSSASWDGTTVPDYSTVGAIR